MAPSRSSSVPLDAARQCWLPNLSMLLCHAANCGGGEVGDAGVGVGAGVGVVLGLGVGAGVGAVFCARAFELSRTMNSRGRERICYASSFGVRMSRPTARDFCSLMSASCVGRFCPHGAVLKASPVPSG